MKIRNLTVGLFSVLFHIILILLFMGMGYIRFVANERDFYGYLFVISVLLAFLIYDLYRCTIIFVRNDNIKIVFPFNPSKKTITLPRSHISMIQFRYSGVRFVQTHLTIFLKGGDIIPTSINIVTSILQFEARRLDKLTEIPVAITGPL